MVVKIEYLIQPNDHGLIVLEGNNGGMPYDNLILYIEETGKVKLDTRTTYTSNDGEPIDEWHERTLTVWITSAAGGHQVLCFEDIRSVLEGERVQPLLKRIIDGHDVRWDGSNYRGRVSDDARDAADDLDWILAETDWDCGWTAWDAAEWLVGPQSDTAAARTIGLTVDSGPEDINRMVDRLWGTALSEKQWIVGGKEALGDAILALQQRLREEAEEAR